MLGYRSQVFIPVLGLVNFPLNRHNRQRPGFGTPQKMLHLADRWNSEIEKYEEPWGSEWIINCIQKLLVPAKFFNQKITNTYIKNPWKPLHWYKWPDDLRLWRGDSLNLSNFNLSILSQDWKIKIALNWNNYNWKRIDINCEPWEK